MRKTPLFLLATSAIATFVAGCGSMSMTSSSPSSNTAPVSISMTDDPPTGVSVLFFQVNITAASLAPSSGSPVSLLSGNNPIPVDVTKLQALAAFLSTANVPAGSYTSLSLTFANPQLVIYNTSDQSIASTCAIGSICQLTPTVDNSATITLNSAPFPVTVSSGSPLGFLVDFHLNTIIQSDLSVNLGVANGVTLAQLPSKPPQGPPAFGFLNGTIQSVSASQNQFTVQAAWGRTFTIDTNSSTTFSDFPTSACSMAGIACLASGQSVQVQISSIDSDGDPLAAQVTYVQAASQQTAEGTVVGFSTTQLKLILHNNLSSSTELPLGGMATVTLGSGATFSVDANGTTIPSGLVFSGVANLAFLQEVQVNIEPGTIMTGSGAIPLSGAWGSLPSVSFTTNSVQLEPGQYSGFITDINSSASTFSLGLPPNIGSTSTFKGIPTPIDTTSQTTYQGFTTDSFSGLQANDFVSASGWLFEPDNGMIDPALLAPTIVAQMVTLHSNGIF